MAEWPVDSSLRPDFTGPLQGTVNCPCHHATERRPDVLYRRLTTMLLTTPARSCAVAVYVPGNPSMRAALTILFTLSMIALAARSSPLRDIASASTAPVNA